MPSSVSVLQIKRAVAREFGIDVAHMNTAERNRKFARPRQVAMSLVRELTGRSLPEIGRDFGGRDHTTVLHSNRAVSQRCQSSVEYAHQVASVWIRLINGEPYSADEQLSTTCNALHALTLGLCEAEPLPFPAQEYIELRSGLRALSHGLSALALAFEDDELRDSYDRYCAAMRAQQLAGAEPPPFPRTGQLAATDSVRSSQRPSSIPIRPSAHSRPIASAGLASVTPQHQAARGGAPIQQVRA